MRHVSACLFVCLPIGSSARLQEGAMRKGTNEERERKGRGQGSGQCAWDTRHRFFTWISFSLPATSCCAFAQRFSHFPLLIASHNFGFCFGFEVAHFKNGQQQQRLVLNVFAMFQRPLRIHTRVCVSVCVCLGYWLAHFF